MLSLFLKGADADAVADMHRKTAMEYMESAHQHRMETLDIDAALNRVAQQKAQIRLLSAQFNSVTATLRDLIDLNDPNRLLRIRTVRSRFFDQQMEDRITQGAVSIDPRFDPDWASRQNYIKPTLPLKQRLPGRFSNLKPDDGYENLLKIEHEQATDIEIGHALFTANYQTLGHFVDLSDANNLAKIRARRSRNLDRELDKLITTGVLRYDPRRDASWVAQTKYVIE